MDEDRAEVFAASLQPDLPDDLYVLEQEAKKAGVPIIRRQTQQLIRFLLALHRPVRILEVGAGVCFSALFMAAFAPVDCQITTIEKDQKRLDKARENLAAYDKKQQITLLEGDAAEILRTLTPSYDLIFMDAAKGQYLNFLPEVKRLLGGGGLLLSDNVLQDRTVLESRFAVPRRNRTIHERMRDYLYALEQDRDFTTVILTDGDGMALCVKNRNS